MIAVNLFKNIHKNTITSITVFYCSLMSLCFIVSAADVPYFNYFFNNINSSILNWVEYGSTTGGLIFGETSYYMPILFCIIVLGLFWWTAIKLKRIFSKSINKLSPRHFNFKNFAGILIFGCVIIGLCIFGIRGRTGYNPIKVSQAYYCQDPFLNQLGINPMFNLLTSYLDDLRKENRPIELLPDDEAIANASQYLNRSGIDGISPLAQIITTDSVSTSHKNIVIILMESMSAHLMAKHGDTRKLTPFLDSLASESRYYRNFYSSGIHTNHGIYATLYSFPTILSRNAMKGTSIPTYSGLPTVLAENGYHNMFFMTHESQYDNMNAFLRTNGFHEIHAEENYPADKIANSFGVQDDYLFSYAISTLNQRAADNQPFFSVILTISNHPPYVIPSHFNPNREKNDEQIVEFADWSIKQFMTEAKRQSWYDNTLFVLLGDHGKIVGTPECDMPQSYNHVPFIIHGNGITPETRCDLSGQIDVAPTILSLLGIGYTQNNFGINLEKESRPYIFYTTDKHIAARDSSRLFIYEPSENRQSCYAITENSLMPAPSDSIYDDMKRYCFSMIQSSQFLVKKKSTVDKPSEISNN